MDIDKTLNERNSTHGNFSEVGALAQTLKHTLRAMPGWDKLLPAQQEALDMDCAKTARILCGDPNERDHWDDKAGYATLGARACTRPSMIETRGALAISTPNPPTPSRLGEATGKPAVPFTLPTKKEEPPKSA